MKRRRLITLVAILIGTCSLTASHANKTFTFTGKVTGVMNTIGQCYVAVVDYYNLPQGLMNAWFMSSNENHCRIAHIAYMTNKTVGGAIRLSWRDDYTADITNLSISSTVIKWPPYK